MSKRSGLGVVGQEASTLEYDDEVKITPFNMKEELEEDGHFDSAGTFIFKKEVDARDNWLEDINWLEVKKNQEKNVLKDTAISDEPDEKVLSKEEKLSMYEELLSYLQPSETVLRSIKRMGVCSDVKKSASASERWLQKKKPKTDNRNGNPEGLIRVTELADQLVQAGDFDVYQKTYEDIHKLIECTKQFEADDELDVLGQELDEKQSNNNNDNEGLLHFKRNFHNIYVHNILIIKRLGIRVFVKWLKAIGMVALIDLAFTSQQGVSATFRELMSSTRLETVP
ncbi:unnamed protein product [Trichobilharzia regenti]|nr:unnamed protein product [Trichobilharzia regenti]